MKQGKLVFLTVLALVLVALAYSIYRKDPVFIIGQGSGLIVYVRNLMLIYGKRSHAES